MSKNNTKINIKKRNIKKEVATVVTQVLVDENDKVVAFGFANFSCVFNAAAFIATSTSHKSPGV